jgi:transposase
VSPIAVSLQNALAFAKKISFNMSSSSSLVGIEVSQDHIVAHILDRESFRCANSADQRPLLLEKLSMPCSCLVVVEATGCNDEALVRDLTAAAHQVSVFRIDREILMRVESDDESKQRYEILRSVPGVGDVTAAMLIAELPELGQLGRQAIASLVGIAPQNIDSGEFSGQRRLRGARSSSRVALYMAALAATRCNPVLQEFYLRLTAQGKNPKVALAACMRKLLVILNTMVKKNTRWKLAVND